MGYPPRVDDDASDDNFTVLQSNREYFLTQDEDGFAIWSVRSDNEDPVLTFPAGEESSEDALAAFRRETRLARWSGVLMSASIAAAVVWILAAAATEVVEWGSFRQAFLTASDRSWQPAFVARAIESIAYSMFVASVGLSVVLWLHRRYRREG